MPIRTLLTAALLLLLAAPALAQTGQAAQDCQAGIQQLQQLSNQGLPIAQPGLALLKTCAKSEDLYVLLAIDHFRRGDTEAGLAALEQGLQSLPDNPRLLANRGAMLNQLGRLDEALASLNRAIQLAPQQGEAYSQRGALYISLKDFAKSRADLEKAIALGAGSSYTHAHLAYVLLQSKQWDQALLSANRAIGLDPGNGRAFRLRSQAYKGLGYCELARRSLFRSCELEGAGSCTDFCAPAGKEQEQAYTNQKQGYLALEQRDYTAALQAFEQAIRLFPHDADFYLDRSVAASKLGQSQAAFGDLGRALELDPGSGRAHFNLGHWYQDANQLLQAYDAYTQALLRDRQSPEYWQNRALVLNDLGRFPEAIADVTQALALVQGRPNYEAMFYDLRGFIHYQAKLPEQALADFKASLQRRPDYGMAHSDIAILYRSQAQCELAKQHFARACELGDTDACKQGCP